MNPYPSLHRLAIRDSGQHQYCYIAFRLRSKPLIASLLYPREGIVGDLSLSGINSQNLSGQLRGMPTYGLPAFWYAR